MFTPSFSQPLNLIVAKNYELNINSFLNWGYKKYLSKIVEEIVVSRDHKVQSVSIYYIRSGRSAVTRVITYGKQISLSRYATSLYKCLKTCMKVIYLR